MKKILEDKLGYFDSEKQEYVIKNMHPKRPLRNYLWSEKVVLNADQFGFGSSLAGIKGERRSIDCMERLVYIKDENTGELYSPNRNYNNLKFDVYECHVGIGYHEVVSSYKGLKCVFALNVPNDDFAVQYNVKLINESNEDKKLTFSFLTNPCASLSYHAAYGKGDKDVEFGGLFYPHYEYKANTEYGGVFFAAEKDFEYYAVTHRDVRGEYGSFENPEVLKNGKLCSKGSNYEDSYIACVSYEVTLKAGESTRYGFSMAIGKSREEAGSVAKKYTSSEAFDKTVENQKKSSIEVFDRYRVSIPDDYMEILTNTWLKRQVSLGKSWARVYGKGFRDRMQDITAFTAFDSEASRAIILDTLSHQRFNGNPIRMFEPIAEAVYNDGAVWIPDAICQYLKESADFSILDEVIPYLEEGTKGTVLEHIIKGMEYLTTDVGEHGLTLFREGDWNDSTNGAGLLGKGESVWTSIATVRALKIFAELLEELKMFDLKMTMLDRAQVMTDNILKYGISNGHFIHGFDDWGNIIGGGDESVEGSFCLNMQSWAVLADICDEDYKNALLDKIENKLACRFGYKLSTPAYTKPVHGVGRTSYFLPGLFENASVYVHGNMFKAVADCVMGRGDNAYDTVYKVTYKNNVDSGVEPYAITNMFLGPDSEFRAGEAPSAWITGSAGWMYRAITEFILGVRAGYNGLIVDPVLPSKWNECKVKRFFRGANYNIDIVRTGKKAVYFNGKQIDGNELPLLKEGESAEVRVEI